MNGGSFDWFAVDMSSSVFPTIFLTNGIILALFINVQCAIIAKNRRYAFL